MASIDPKAQLSAMAMYGWISGKMSLAALPNIQGDVTKESLMTALNNLKDVDTQGLSHPITTTELTNPAFKRYFNHSLINYRIHDTVPLREGDFYDIESALPK